MFSFYAFVASALVASSYALAVPGTLSKRQFSGPGIQLTNNGANDQEFDFYPNGVAADGSEYASFDNPSITLTVPCCGASQFVSIPDSWRGRVQRGTAQPSTWVEFQTMSSGTAWGDVSLEFGCDGAATVVATDGVNTAVGGFTQDIVSGAPQAALTTNYNGVTVLDQTMGWWEGPGNQAAIDYERQVVGQQQAYIVGGDGTTVVSSSNNVLAVTFY